MIIKKRNENTIPDLAEIVALVFPATKRDYFLCAIALSIVEQAPKIRDVDYADAMLLAAKSGWCKAFLSYTDQLEYEVAEKEAPADMFVADCDSFPWQDICEYLICQRALVLAPGFCQVGPNAEEVKAALPGGVDKIVAFALVALERVIEIRAEQEKKKKAIAE